MTEQVKTGNKKCFMMLYKLVAVTLAAIFLMNTSVEAATPKTGAYYSGAQLKKKYGSKTNPDKGAKPATVPRLPMNGFAYADFAKYNSLASENGLGGTPIYLIGTIMDIEILANNNNVYDTALFVNDCDGYQWCMRADVASANYDLFKNTFNGKSGLIFGLYSGYTVEMKRPMMKVTLISDQSGLNGVPMSYFLTGTATALANNIALLNAASNANSVAAVNATTNNSTNNNTNSKVTYVLNSNPDRMVFHKTSCTYVNIISSEHRKDSYDSRDKIIADGYTACQKCNP